MALFHDEEDTPGEPVPGLPASLPDGEHIVWQGRPNAFALAVDALHVRAVAIYFAAFVALKAVGGFAAGAPAPTVVNAAAGTAAIGLFAVALLVLLGGAMARKALFTVTNRRVVIRHGAAIRKYINVPFGDVSSLDVRGTGDGRGNIAIATAADRRIPILHLWPFARPLRVRQPVPLLRSVENAEEVATKLADAIRAASPGTISVAAKTETAPARAASPAGGRALAEGGTA